MAVFTMVIGLGRSGKSTYAAKYADNTGATLVEWCETNSTKTYGRWLKYMADLLTEGCDIVLDGGPLNANRRARLLHTLPECTKQCVIIATPFHICIERWNKVSIDELNKQRKSFEPPYYNEGWDAIEFKFADVLLDSADQFKMELKFDQKNSHHRYTVGNHESKASEYAVDKGFNKVVDLAAKFHDCGKMYCQVIHSDGEAHYPNHANIGAYQLMTMFSFKKFLQFYGDEALETLALVAWHMTPYQFKRCESPKQALLDWCESKEFDALFAEHLWQLHQADVWAH